MTTAATTTAPSAEAAFPWWATVIQGVSAIVIGIMLLAVPARATLILVQFLGIYWLVSGVIYLVSMFLDSHQWGWKLALGVLGVLAGLAVIQHPLYSAVMVPAVMIVVLGIWGLVIGAVDIFQAFTGAGWGRGILGVVSIFFGLILLAQPWLAALSLPFVLGLFGLVGGIAALVMGIRERPAEAPPAAQNPPAELAA